MKKTEKQTGRRGRRLAALALAAVMTLAQAFAPAMTAADRTCGGTAGTWTAFAGEADTEAVPAPAEPAAEETAAPAPQTEAPAEQPEETTPSDQAEQTGAGTEGQDPAPEQSGSGTEAADPAPEQTGSEENAGVQEAEIAAQTSGAAVQAEEAGAQTSGDSEGSGDASTQDAAQAPAMTLAQDGGQALPEEGSESVYEAWTEAGDGETADHLPEETAQAEAAETAEGTGTGAENETAAEAASEAETETGTETETEAEAETETETETEATPRRVYIAEAEGWEAELEKKDGLFLPGEEVRFTARALEAKDNLQPVLRPFAGDEAAAEAEETEVPEMPVLWQERSAGHLGTYVMEEEEQKGNTVTETYTIAGAGSGEEQQDAAEPEIITCSFEMPDFDVLIDGEMLLSSTGEGSIAEAPAGAGDDGLIDENDYYYEAGKITVQSMMNQYWHGPSSWSTGGGDGYGSYVRTTLKKAYWIDENGNKVWKYAYCVQPLAFYPGSGTYDTSDTEQLAKIDPQGSLQNRRLAKALYYLFGGPAWGDSVELGDGSSINLKKLLESYGCTGKEEYYEAAHLILSYIYEKEDWSKVDGCTVDSGAIVRGVLSETAKNAITDVVAKIDTMDDAVTELSAYNLSASFSSDYTQMQSQKTRYRAAFANTAAVSLPGGVTLVNVTQGTSGTGKVQVNGGDRFYLQAAPGSVEGVQKITMTTTYPVNFTAYKLLKDGKQQDISFGYMTGSRELALTVDWPRAQGRVGVKKVDASTKDGAPVADAYSFDGAAYGLYSDKACTKLLETIRVGKDGSGAGEGLYPPGTYYLKETQAPSCGLYEKSSEVLSAVLSGEAAAQGKTVTVKAAEQPRTLRICVQKTDADTGKKTPVTSALPFTGALYGVYADKACTKQVASLRTDEKGFAQAKEAFPAADWYIKEIEAPKGYLPDPAVHQVSAEDGVTAILKNGGVCEVTSPERVIRGNVALSKILGASGGAQLAKPDDLSGIVYRFTYDADPSVSFTVMDHAVQTEKGKLKANCIETDTFGYATTQSDAYPYGTLIYGSWTIEELCAPEGYEALESGKVEITRDGQLLRYVVSDERITAWLAVQKKDALTGSALPFAGVQFEILDGDGAPVTMFDPSSGANASVWKTGADGRFYLPQPLPAGTYTLKETGGEPEGYGKMEPLPFTVSKAYANPEQPLVITCAEPPLTGGISVVKKDALTREPAGAGFVFEVSAAEDITDPAGTVREGTDADGAAVPLKKGTVVGVITTDESGRASLDGLFAGLYTVREIAAAKGYALDPVPQEISVTPGSAAGTQEGADGDADAGADAQAGITTAEFADHPTSLILKKRDGTRDIPVEGAVFLLRRESAPESGDGAWEQELVTGADGQATVRGLIAGSTYTIQEIRPAPGYVPDDTVRSFAVDTEGKIDGSWEYVLEISNVPNEVSISKTDMTGGQEIPGAKLVLRDEAGQTVEEWVSGTEPRRLTGLTAGTYTLTEITAPYGYEMAETITFVLTDSLEVQQVEMKDAPWRKVQISKSDMTGDGELPGALLEIRDADGEVMESWISGEEPHLVSLPAGTYTLTETTAPAGYVTAETITFTVEKVTETDCAVTPVKMRDAPIGIEILKKDGENGRALPGAELSLTGPDGKEIRRWTSTEKPEYISPIPAGKYTLKEISAPKGYEKAEDMEITVEEKSEVQTFAMTDRRTPPPGGKKEGGAPLTLDGAAADVRLMGILLALSACAAAAGGIGLRAAGGGRRRRRNRR